MLRLVLALACTLGLLLPGVAAAQDYPTRPVRLIVGYGAGGATDLAARIVAGHLEKTLGQPITVENRPGGNGTVGTRAVFTAAPDGYTLGMTSGSILTVLPWTMDIGFDPLKLTFIGSTHESFYALFVKGDSPWRTVQELVAHAKANPNQLVTANSGGFGLPDIAMAQLARAAGGFQYRTVPTTGGAEQVLKLLSGDVQAEANSAAATVSHLKSGAIRALLVFSTSWPELERMGVPLSSKVYGFSARNLSAVVGPPGLPEPIRKKLEDALAAAMRDPDTLARLEKIGELIEYKTGPQIKEAAARVQAEQLEVGKILDKVKK
jgi:tripartite-type tricarboxylate transporter receptor subunit TctC